MERYKLLGLVFQPDDAIGCVEDDKESFGGVGHYKPTCNHTYSRRDDVESVLRMCILTHLEYPVGDVDLKSMLADGCAVAVDYFYGDYISLREYPSIMSKSNPDLSWIDVFRGGLLLSLLGQDDQCRQQLADWIVPELAADPTPEERPETYSTYYKALAEWLKGGALTGSEAIEGAAKPEGPKLLMRSLAAICSNDAEAFAESFGAYVSYFLESELGFLGIETFISLDGSILAALADEQGIACDALSEKQAAAVMTRETLGL